MKFEWYLEFMATGGQVWWKWNQQNGWSIRSGFDKHTPHIGKQAGIDQAEWLSMKH
jgi:hypothetical protein